MEIRGLCVTRGDFTLTVDRLAVEEGESFAILGPTGSGKTILLESIAGAFPIERGQALLNGVDIDTVPVQRRSLGILYQDCALFPHMTVRENIAYGLKRARMSRREIDERVTEITTLFGIGHIGDQFPGTISGGEAQRAALARAIVLHPDVLLLDEPFSALDPTTKRSMYALLRKIRTAYRFTIIFVTHDFTEAQMLADRVGIILGGRLRCVVTADELFSTEHDPSVERFLGMDGHGQAPDYEKGAASSARCRAHSAPPQAKPPSPVHRLPL